MQKRSIFIIIIAVAVAAAGIYYFFSDSPISGGSKLTKAETVVAPRFLYDLPVDSFDVVQDKIGKNEFLADILLKHHVDYPTINRLANAAREVFDVRKIRYGNKYTLLLNHDSLAKARYFIYEISPVDFVIYDLGDTIHARLGAKEVAVVIDTASGIINTSLWNALIDNGDDPNLANELSEIYAWTIDFFGIHKGDSYTVIYERRLVDGENIGIGRVLAANMNHFGKDLPAFYFVQNEQGDYFDEEANSLRRTFLKAPLKFKRISSGFSYSRMHPILKYRRPHLGVDYAADHGTPVVSIGDGVVEFAKWDNGGGGRAVKIKHNGTYTTLYMHLSKYGAGIKGGAHVKQGQVVGYVGSSGMATGPHLDFRVYRNGKPIDPTKMESPPAHPVDTAYRQEFFAQRDKWRSVLRNIPVTEADSLLTTL
jgi:murein DD-endopeptidase MepM/ murein hydrolase activator NlpD